MRGGRSGVRVSSASLFVACLGTTFTGIVLAAEEELFFSNLPVVATVSRLPQPLAEAPGSVTVIDRELIRQSGARSVSDLLRLVPGFNVTPMNTDAPRVVYHGLSDEEYSPRVQVLVDGRSQYSPLFRGGVNWNTLPVALEDIDRIEVLRGSNSAAYGSNAFLGVVNVITLDASQTKGLAVAVNHGSQGVRDEFLRGGGRLGAVDFRLTVKQTADQGYRFLPVNPGDPSDIADDFRQRLVDFRADVALSERDELQLGLGFVKNRLDTGRIDEEFNPPRQVSQRNSYVHAQWRHAMSPGEDVSVRYFHAEERTGDAFGVTYLTGIPALPTLFFDLDLGGRSTRHDLEIQHTLSLAARGRLVWGFGSRFDHVQSRSQFYEQRENDRRNHRLFGNLEWRFPPFAEANFGATWEYDSVGGSSLAPRLNFNLHPAEGQTVRLGLSRAYRSPSAFDAKGDQRVVPTISFPPLFDRTYLAMPRVQSESIDVAELGYLGEFHSLRASLDVRLFDERIDNRIMQAPRNLAPPYCEQTGFPVSPCGSANYTDNAEWVRIRGFEYQLKWQPFESTRLLLNQAFTEIDQRFLDSFLATTSAVSGLKRAQQRTRQSAPADSTSLMLMQKLPGGVELSATHHWVGGMKWTTNSEVQRYRRLDLRLAYPFRSGNWRGEIAFVSQSANGDHAEFKNSRIIGERHWLSLRFDL